MKKWFVFLLVLCLGCSAALAETVELSPYLGRPIAEAAATLPYMIVDEEECAVYTEDQDIFLSCDPHTLLTDFVYSDAEEGYTLYGIAPGMTLAEVLGVLQAAGMEIDTGDYAYDYTVFAVNADFTRSVTVEFSEDDDICLSVSAISYTGVTGI